MRAGLVIFLGTIMLVFVSGMAISNWGTLSAYLARPPLNQQTTIFERCNLLRQTCVIDGDTIRLQGRKIRIADIDTPEIFSPKCDSELEMGLRATKRLQELLSVGPFEIEAIPGRDRDQYGRELRVLTRSGHSIGDQLVEEGLARTWTGRREPWC